MKVHKESLFDRFVNRLSPANASRAIKAMRHARHRLEIDYMAVKEMSELEERYRQKAKNAIQALRQWEIREAVQNMNDVYRQREYEVLKGQAHEAVILWHDIRRDHREIRDMAFAYYAKPANDDRKFGK